MKWQLVPESREEMLRTAWRGGRGGHRGSSNPSSPSQLSYITSGPRDMAARDPISARKRKVSPSGSPQPRTSSLRDSHLTPVRPMRKPLPDEPSTIGGGADDSPLPLPRAGATARKLNAASSSSALGLVENAPASPTLASSYLQDDGASFVTPAPLRVHPKFAPPSTAQRPSQHMPTSSPAPFWKYADIGSTPLRPVGAPFDLSPTKPVGGGGLGGGSLGGGAGSGAGVPGSSSPPRRSKSPVQSPTRRPAQAQAQAQAVVEEESPSPVGAGEEEDGGFDLTKYVFLLLVSSLRRGGEGILLEKKRVLTIIDSTGASKASAATTRRSGTGNRCSPQATGTCRLAGARRTARRCWAAGR